MSGIVSELRQIAHIMRNNPPLSIDKPRNDIGTWNENKYFIPGDALKEQSWEELAKDTEGLLDQYDGLDTWLT